MQCNTVVESLLLFDVLSSFFPLAASSLMWCDHSSLTCAAIFPGTLRVSSPDTDRPTPDVLGYAGSGEDEDQAAKRAVVGRSYRGCLRSCWPRPRLTQIDKDGQTEGHGPNIAFDVGWRDSDSRESVRFDSGEDGMKSIVGDP